MGLTCALRVKAATYRADAPAFVPVGAIWPRLGRASSGILGQGRASQA